MHAYHIVGTYCCVCTMISTKLSVRKLDSNCQKNVSFCYSRAAAECRRAYGSLQHI